MTEPFAPRIPSLGLQSAADFWALFDHYGIKRSLGIVRGIGWIEFQVPVIPEGLLEDIALWKMMGQRIELKVKNFWKAETPETHLFFESLLGE